MSTDLTFNGGNLVLDLDLSPLDLSPLNSAPVKSLLLVALSGVIAIET